MLVAFFVGLKGADTRIHISTMNRSEVILAILKSEGLLDFIAAVAAVDGVHQVANGALNNISDQSTYANTADKKSS